MDMLTAAHAMSCGVSLVTNNDREFRRIEGLRLENWTRLSVARGNPLAQTLADAI